MSLFFSNLVFENPTPLIVAQMKISIFVGSLISGMLGYFWLVKNNNPQTNKR